MLTTTSTTSTMWINNNVVKLLTTTWTYRVLKITRRGIGARFSGPWGLPVPEPIRPTSTLTSVFMISRFNDQQNFIMTSFKIQCYDSMCVMCYDSMWQDLTTWIMIKLYDDTKLWCQDLISWCVTKTLMSRFMMWWFKKTLTTKTYDMIRSHDVLLDLMVSILWCDDVNKL